MAPEFLENDVIIEKEIGGKRKQLLENCHRNQGPGKNP